MQAKKDLNNRLYLKTRYSAANYKRLAPFFDAVESTEEKYFKFTSDGYMPLCIENQGYTFIGYPVYSMTHYHEQNGDLMKDPDMTLLVDREHGHIIPHSFQQDGCPWTKYGTYYREAFQDESHFFPHIITDLDTFLNTWSKNIIDQGFQPEQAHALNLDEFATQHA